MLTMLISEDDKLIRMFVLYNKGQLGI